MTGQLAIEFTPAPRTKRAESISERFARFHAENPDVYRELRELALAGRRRGLKRLGMKALFEIVRWNRALATRGEEFRLNNNFTAHYARLLMEQEPELVGIFETRGSEADR